LFYVATASRIAGGDDAATYNSHVHVVLLAFGRVAPPARTHVVNATARPPMKLPQRDQTTDSLCSHYYE